MASPQPPKPRTPHVKGASVTIIGVGEYAELALTVLQAARPKCTPCVVSYGTLSDARTIPCTLRPFYAGALVDQDAGADRQFVLATGDCSLRQAIARECGNLSYVTIVHPAASVDPGAVLGQGTVVCAGAVLGRGTRVGAHTILCQGASVDDDGDVGDFCVVGPGARLGTGATLHEGAVLQAGVHMLPGLAVAPWEQVAAGTIVTASTAPIPMYEPLLDNYKASMLDAIQSGWISSHGRYIEKAEAVLRDRLGVRHAMLLANGTVATHCLFLALKYRHPSIRKIYVPNNVYVAAWNCALMEYPADDVAVVKTDPATWNMAVDDASLHALEPNAAVLVVHNVGNVVNVPRLKRLRPDLVFVEDNCEGIFGTYEGVASGCSPASLCASLSFFANKSITAGEGGAFLTNDTDLYHYVYKATHQGLTKRRYVHDVLGFNYRMTNVQAALLYDQLCDVDRILGLKRRIMSNYERMLAPALRAGVLQLQQCEPDTVKGDWMFAVRIVDHAHDFDHVSTFMRQHGVDVRPMFYPIETHDHLRGVARVAPDHDITSAISRQVIMLPSSPTLPERQQQHIVDVVVRYAAQHGGGRKVADSPIKAGPVGTMLTVAAHVPAQPLCAARGRDRSPHKHVAT